VIAGSLDWLFDFYRRKRRKQRGECTIALCFLRFLLFNIPSYDSMDFC